LSGINILARFPLVLAENREAESDNILGRLVDRLDLHVHADEILSWFITYTKGRTFELWNGYRTHLGE